MSDALSCDGPRPPATVLPLLQGACFDAAVAQDVTFHSPAADYHGRADVVHVLRTIAAVVEDVAETSVVEGGGWRTRTVDARIGDAAVQGILRERCDAAGRVAEVDLYLRPFRTLRAGIADMRARLERDPLPSSVHEGRPAP